MGVRYMDRNFIFALDIGTRNVVGSLGEMRDNKYVVLDHVMIEHPERAMFDGQIHDIEKVAKVVNKIKEQLEQRNSTTLKKVAIAAAGRSLRTEKVTVERNLDYIDTITKELIDNLELEGIQTAQKNIEGMLKKESKYYCVGYSVTNYYLDDSMISNPKDHRGSKLSASIIATFLPHIVVDSLYTVVDRAGLEVTNLTLEPIAAINVAIPPKLRLLNIAMVDVGAGTSDIAITRDGAVISYAMVAVAGDEITELLSREYLLDFDSAEKLKLSLNNSKNVKFSDIVGIEYELEVNEIIERISPAIEDITLEIAKKIIEFNEKTPSAIFLVGGGCQIPTFNEALARHLNLPKERVAIKGVENLDNIIFDKDPLKGPEFITPVGIGVTALLDKEQDFLQVIVNEKQIRLFNSKQLTVSDALILIGYNARNLLATKGNPINFSINGVSKKILGDSGSPAKIYVNGIAASLDTKIANKDIINVEAAAEGTTPIVHILSYIDSMDKVIVNSKQYSLVKEIVVNGKHVNPDYVISDHDEIITRNYKNLYDFVLDKSIDYNVEDSIFINDLDSNIQSPLNNNDDIVIRRKKVENVVKSMELIVNGKKITIDNVQRELIFVDIFDHFHFDLTRPKGILDLKLNQKRASYTDRLKTGDIIDISWK
jgi:cell division protein FtsA